MLNLVVPYRQEIGGGRYKMRFGPQEKAAPRQPREAKRYGAVKVPYVGTINPSRVATCVLRLCVARRHYERRQQRNAQRV